MVPIFVSPTLKLGIFSRINALSGGATDRDRLYALFLANRLPSAGLQQDDFQLLHIAPHLRFPSILNSNITYSIEPRQVSEKC